MTRPFRPGWWGLAAFACALVLGLAVLPPFVSPGFRYALMQGFDLSCHQIPERSFQIGGIPFAVCHRCTGVFAGLVVGSLAVAAFRDADSAFVHHARLILMLSILPMIIDWTLDALGLGTSLPLSRVLTGLVFGVAAGYTFARALAVPPSPEARPQPVEALLPRLSHPTPTADA